MFGLLSFNYDVNQLVILGLVLLWLYIVSVVTNFIINEKSEYIENTEMVSELFRKNFFNFSQILWFSHIFSTISPYNRWSEADSTVDSISEASKSPLRALRVRESFFELRSSPMAKQGRKTRGRTPISPDRSPITTPAAQTDIAMTPHNGLRPIAIDLHRFLWRMNHTITFTVRSSFILPITQVLPLFLKLLMEWTTTTGLLLCVWV